MADEPEEQPDCSPVHGCTCINLAGQWECGRCGSNGDGFWNPHDGFVWGEGGAHECEG